jgi:DNA-binding NtrC family response regulator
LASILLIDDDAVFSRELVNQFGRLGHQITAVDSAEAGLDRLGAGEKYDVVLLDNCLPGGMTGLEFLAALRDREPRVPVILMTSAHQDDTAIQAIAMGAFSYVIKPLQFAAIIPKLKPDVEHAALIARQVEPVPLEPSEADAGPGASRLAGQSDALLNVLRQIGQFVSDGFQDKAVLILGETGTGKELAATAIHTNSCRRSGPFVPLNCTTLPETLVESELFGYEKGAYSGAERTRKGWFEQADGGTLFLDEIGDMPLNAQAKLLRVLQEREVVRLSGNERIPVNVRVLAATKHDLCDLVARKLFRDDLAHRLNGATLRMPPLRERKGDIEYLARHFLRQGCATPPALHKDAESLLLDYSWPGNVRELRSVMDRARLAVRARHGCEVLPEDLDFGFLGVPKPRVTAGPAEALGEDAAMAGLRQAAAWAWESRLTLAQIQERLECELLRLAAASGLSEVALHERLGLARNTLRTRLKQHGLKPSGGRAS